MSINAQIETEIIKVLTPMMGHVESIIKPKRIADVVLSNLDPESNSPATVSYGCIQHLRGKVREVLARKYDAVTRTQEQIRAGQPDLFDGVLQDYYPVKRSFDGEAETIYVPKDDLSDADVEKIAHRMETGADSLKRHAKALRSYQRNRKQAA